MKIEALLAQLQQGPQSLSQLAQRLALPSGRLESALRQLQGGGYVEPQTCSTSPVPEGGCSFCSVKRFCSKPIDEENWQLTPKGQRSVAT